MKFLGLLVAILAGVSAEAFAACRVFGRAYNGAVYEVVSIDKNGVQVFQDYGQTFEIYLQGRVAMVTITGPIPENGSPMNSYYLSGSDPARATIVIPNSQGVTRYYELACQLD